MDVDDLNPKETEDVSAMRDRGEEHTDGIQKIANAARWIAAVFVVCVGCYGSGVTFPRVYELGFAVQALTAIAFGILMPASNQRRIAYAILLEVLLLVFGITS